MPAAFNTSPLPALRFRCRLDVRGPHQESVTLSPTTLSVLRLGAASHPDTAILINRLKTILPHTVKPNYKVEDVKSLMDLSGCNCLLSILALRNKKNNVVRARFRLPRLPRSDVPPLRCLPMRSCSSSACQNEAAMLLAEKKDTFLQELGEVCRFLLAFFVSVPFCCTLARIPCRPSPARGLHTPC